MPDDQPAEYRFGFSRDQIIAEITRHSGVFRDGCYVPTREEVATWPADRLWGIMLGWWWESPSSLIPNDEQVAESVAVLRARADAESEAIRKIIAQAPPPSDSREEGRHAEGGSNEDAGEGG